MPPLVSHPRLLRSPVTLLRAAFATSRPQRPSGYRSSLRRISASPPSKANPSQTPGNNEPPKEKPSSVDAVSSSLQATNPADNSLLTPVNIPPDPDGVLNESHPAAAILSHSSLVVTRQIEMMNIMLGFEQANRYVIMDPQGNHVGYMAERDLGMGNMFKRQMFSTHRSFTTHVFDKHEREVLRFHRPFAWISSRIGIYDPLEVASVSHSVSTALQNPQAGALSTDVAKDSAQISPLNHKDMRIIGEAQQQWAPLRRKYNLFLFRQSPTEATQMDTKRIAAGDLPLSNSQQLQVSQAAPDSRPGKGDYGQFAYVDEPFLSWDFSLLSADGRLIGSVNRNFAGFGREIFTDTGVYMLRMDAAGLAEEPKHLISKTGTGGDQAYGSPKVSGLTLDQRAIMLATAVSVDFDYFSRHSGGGGMMPMWFPWWGGGAGAEAGAAGGAAGEAGVGEAAGGAVGGAGRAAGGMAEGGVMGAGGVAGYEAMQRGAAEEESRRDVSPTPTGADNPPDVEMYTPEETTSESGQGEDLWG